MLKTFDGSELEHDGRYAMLKFNTIFICADFVVFKWISVEFLSWLVGWFVGQ